MPFIASLKVWADLEILTAPDLNGALSEIRTTVNSFAAFKDAANTFTLAQTFSAGVTVVGAVGITGATTVVGALTATTLVGNGAAITALAAANLTGTLPDAVFPATLPALSGANLTALPSANLTGTLPNGVFPATLPAASAANLTAIPAANIVGTLPAISGANLTVLNASNLASGTVDSARLPATIAQATTFSSGGSAVVISNQGALRFSAGAGAAGSHAALIFNSDYIPAGASSPIALSNAPGVGSYYRWIRVDTGNGSETAYIPALVL